MIIWYYFFPWYCLVSWFYIFSLDKIKFLIKFFKKLFNFLVYKVNGRRSGGSRSGGSRSSGTSRSSSGTGYSGGSSITGGTRYVTVNHLK